MDIKEKRFESDIESYMLSYGGFVKGDQKIFLGSYALIKSDLWI